MRNIKEFNVTGICIPEKHYMVDISDKMAKILKMIEKGDYFTINRARQYGKTTTLYMIQRALSEDYYPISLSFEGVGDAMYQDPESFCQRFLLRVYKTLEKTDKDFADRWLDDTVTNFDLLSYHIEKLCEDKKIVLMIDEVDKASDNQIFLHFLGMLRSGYLSQQTGASKTFQSVILAGVYDIKNIKLKLASEGLLDPETSGTKIYNSPWNIAADFNVDMSFSPTEIATMLNEYESDHNTGMDIELIADEIYSYTSGYPYLVSRICKHIDEKLDRDWTLMGVQEAVEILLYEQNTLFDDVFKNIQNNEALHDYIYNMIIGGEEPRYVRQDPIADMGLRYGFFKNENNKIRISNRIFETLMAEYFVVINSRSQKPTNRKSRVFKLEVVRDGKFDMELCLLKFAEHYAEIYSDSDIEFLEKHGRMIFLTYLSPLLYGEGFYHLESQFTDHRRMDLVVNYEKEQFVIELKIWRGEQYEKQAIEQLSSYLDKKRADTGYMLTFDFRKPENKTPKTEWVEMNAKRIFNVVV